MSNLNLGIKLSEAAKNHLVNTCNKNNSKFVLLQAKGGGCAGFKYDWSFITEEQINDHDMFINLTETHYLIVDSNSSLHLMGMNIDFVETIAGATLEISNPNAKSSCGCGESFGV